MPCTCMNNTSCNQPKVVPELEIPVPRGKEQQLGEWVILELLGSMFVSAKTASDRDECDFVSVCHMFLV